MRIREQTQTYRNKLLLILNEKGKKFSEIRTRMKKCSHV